MTTPGIAALIVGIIVYLLTASILIGLGIGILVLLLAGGGVYSRRF